MKHLALILTAALCWCSSTNAADFDGDSRDDIAVFRPSTGLWSIRGITRAYFGGIGDVARPGDYNGDGISDIAIFRGSTGLWAVRSITRVYYGQDSDTPIQGGGGQRIYDYVVKSGNAEDLVNALESNSYNSVFIPEGTYTIDQVINVNYVSDIVGEDKHRTIIHFTDTNYLWVQADYCRIRNIQFEHEDGDLFLGPLVDLDQVEGVVVENCRFDGNDYVDSGLHYDSDCNWLQVLNCYVSECSRGFDGDTAAAGTTFSNCQANSCSTGFYGCSNLSSCVVRGSGALAYGFSSCNRLASCSVFNVAWGFYNCKYISSSQADGSGIVAGGTKGYLNCMFISSSEAYSWDTGFNACTGIATSRALSCNTGNSGCSYVGNTVWSE